ncbi:MAG: ThuA domain-containing protein [Verrucomicrobiales bacterium]|nr:ThuA domain-containing protein [Verrucomicrobiales bacterium]
MFARFLFVMLCGVVTAAVQAGEVKKVTLIAGKPSHGPAQHEHNAGVLLFKKCLEEGAADQVAVTVHLNSEWPGADELAAADTLLIYSDGQGNHPALQEDHLAQLGKEMARGCGLVCVHYAVEPTLENGNAEFINWLGGCFEIDWSVNPHWEANFKQLPKHPVSRGVKPFGTLDEWYYHMRFRKGLRGVTPILTDLPPPDSLSRPDGAHSGNPEVRAAVLERHEPQHVAWAVERDDGGRGFGFTGGHFHQGWGHPDQRRLLLNAILWTAKAEVPETGVNSTVTDADLQANLDPKPGQGLPLDAKKKKGK